MPLGNPIQASGPGAMPYTPTRRYGGGAGTVYTNPWGAKTAVPKGGPVPQGPGRFGFGAAPTDEYGTPMAMDPQSKAETDNLMNPQSPQGQGLKTQIDAMRRRLLQAQNQRQ